MYKYEHKSAAVSPTVKRAKESTGSPLHNMRMS